MSACDFVLCYNAREIGSSLAAESYTLLSMYGGFLGHHKYNSDVVDVVAMQVRPVEIQVNIVELHLSSVEKQVSDY